MHIYLIGSLRNPRVPEVAAALRAEGITVCDHWYAAGPEADDHWQRYSQARGQSYVHALHQPYARHIFEFDKWWLDACDAALLVTPAGKSGCLELGYMIGCGKPGLVLVEQEPERWDVMLGFATTLHTDLPSVISTLRYIYPHEGAQCTPPNPSSTP